MGNRISITYEGNKALLTSTQKILLVKLFKNNDEKKYNEIDIIKKGKYYELIYAFALGYHGAFKTLFDEMIMHKLTPIFGSINITYKDYDAPQVLHRTIKAKNDSFGGVF